MLNKFGQSLLALSFIGLGVGVMLDATLCSSRYEYRWDFGPYHKFVGAIMVAIGIVVGVLVVKPRWAKLPPDVLVCPRCDQPFDSQVTRNGRCPQCGAFLEDIEGFYERRASSVADADGDPSASSQNGGQEPKRVDADTDSQCKKNREGQKR
jgi:hypothetical protein